ncbi:hypothetical protein [Streptomyces sp. UNOB3_S3]|uniref:hypothetical protein n=1 Tax=Streptomyces sp. UNOB3_S3 TaxID=2871682 RepID=UPI001E452356|nr:hypothetical protein [Streptomyces sp. UNOB3_S3]MCC3774253.1 hypothetical protein [Streptomyces sp. UNOB3_S3]
METEWTEESIQRITAESATVKQWVRQLTADNRTLDERLKAARSNVRFQDRRPHTCHVVAAGDDAGGERPEPSPQQGSSA